MNNSDLFKQSRNAIRIPRFAILFALVFSSARTIHAQTTSQPEDAFIAGCAAGAFDSYSALKSNCPKRQSQAATVTTQPLAYTPQQLEEMNKYAQQGAAALQQYLHRPATPSSIPSTGDTISFPSNTRTQYDSTEYQPMHFYPINGSTAGSGGVLAGIAKAAQAYQQRSASFASYDSSLKLTQALRDLEKARAELADAIAWGEFLKKQRATREVGAQELSEAMAAGAPIVKAGLRLDEAMKLQSQLSLDPHQKHIFPDTLTIAVDSKGQMHFDRVGLPIEEFQYTLVGDIVTPDEQEMIRARSWQGFEGAPNEFIGNSPLETEPDLYSTMDWLNASSCSNGNPAVEIGAASYITSVYSPLVATAPGQGRLVVLTTSQLFTGNFYRVESSFNIRDIDPHTVALRKSPHGNFYIFTARTTGGALKIYDRTHGQAMSSIAFEVSVEYGPQFTKAFETAVVLARKEQEQSAGQQARLEAETKQYPNEVKVVKTGRSNDGLLVVVAETPAAKYTLTCASGASFLRCPILKFGDIVHLDWKLGPENVFVPDSFYGNLPPEVFMAGLKLEKTEPR
jgi:hypothetical protein